MRPTCRRHHGQHVRNVALARFSLSVHTVEAALIDFGSSRIKAARWRAVLLTSIGLARTAVYAEIAGRLAWASRSACAQCNGRLLKMGYCWFTSASRVVCLLRSNILVFIMGEEIDIIWSQAVLCPVECSVFLTKVLVPSIHRGRRARNSRWGNRTRCARCLRRRCRRGRCLIVIAPIVFWCRLSECALVSHGDGWECGDGDDGSVVDDGRRGETLPRNDNNWKGMIYEARFSPRRCA